MVDKQKKYDYDETQNFEKLISHHKLDYKTELKNVCTYLIRYNGGLLSLIIRENGVYFFNDYKEIAKELNITRKKTIAIIKYYKAKNWITQKTTDNGKILVFSSLLRSIVNEKI